MSFHRRDCEPEDRSNSSYSLSGQAVVAFPNGEDKNTRDLTLAD
jgi:hypothetical protein